MSAGPRPPPRWREPALLAALVLLAAAARARHVVGFGFGDDAYYAYTSYRFLTEGFAGLDLSFGSNHRIGLWIPVSLSFRWLGVHDASFVLFAGLTSLLLIPVVHALGTRLFGPAAGWLAAVAQAVSTFDVAFASTLTIDIPTSFLLASSLLLFLEAERVPAKRNVALHGLAAFCVLWAYYIKLPSPVILLVHGSYTLWRWRMLRRHVAFYLWIAVFFLGAFASDFHRSGDALHYFHREMAFAPGPSLFAEVASRYPRWMFLPEVGSRMRLFGPHFFAGTAALAVCLAVPRLRRASVLPVLWLAWQIAFLQFFPAEWSPPYRVMPRFFRYAHALVPPTSLLIGAALGLWWEAAWPFREPRRGLRTAAAAACALAVLAYSAASLRQGLAIARLYADHYADQRHAARFLAAQPPAPIYSDFQFYDRFNFDTGYQRMHQPRWAVDGLEMQRDIVGKHFLEPLRRIEEGYVVMGGSRGVPWDTNWTLQRRGFQPPAHWTPVMEYVQPVDPWRPEVLQIYEVRKRPGGPPVAGFGANPPGG